MKRYFSTVDTIREIPAANPNGDITFSQITYVLIATHKSYAMVVTIYFTTLNQQFTCGVRTFGGVSLILNWEIPIWKIMNRISETCGARFVRLWNGECPHLNLQLINFTFIWCWDVHRSCLSSSSSSSSYRTLNSWRLMAIFAPMFLNVQVLRIGMDTSSLPLSDGCCSVYCCLFVCVYTPVSFIHTASVLDFFFVRNRYCV